jgi:hypothetical protein
MKASKKWAWWRAKREVWLNDGSIGGKVPKSIKIINHLKRHSKTLNVSFG